MLKVTQRNYFLILSSMLLVACAALPPALSVDDAVAMAKAGDSPDTIILRMRQSNARYLLSASDIVRLNAAGLPVPVLDYMQQTQLESVREDERLKQMDKRFPWPLYCNRFRCVY